MLRWMGIGMRRGVVAVDVVVVGRNRRGDQRGELGGYGVVVMRLGEGYFSDGEIAEGGGGRAFVSMMLLVAVMVGSVIVDVRFLIDVVDDDVVDDDVVGRRIHGGCIWDITLAPCRERGCKPS